MMTGGTLTPQMVGTIIGAVVMALLGGGALGRKNGKQQGKAEGKAEALQIGPQPFMVQLQQEFVTRRELEKLEGTMNAHVAEMKGMMGTSSAEMKGLFAQTMAAMTTQTSQTAKKIEGSNDRLNRKIEEVASGAYNSRGKIHHTLNSQGERLSRVEATSDVAAQISKLADAIAPPVSPKIQPTHTHNPA